MFKRPLPVAPRLPRVLGVIDFPPPPASDVSEDTVGLVTEDDGVVRTDVNASGQGPFVDAVRAARALLGNAQLRVHIDEIVLSLQQHLPTASVNHPAAAEEAIVPPLDG